MEDSPRLCHSHTDLPEMAIQTQDVKLRLESGSPGPQPSFSSDLGFPGPHFTLSWTLAHIVQLVVVGPREFNLPASRLPQPHGVMAGEVLQALQSTGLISFCLHEVWKRKVEKNHMRAWPPHGLEMAKRYPFAGQSWAVNSSYWETYFKQKFQGSKYLCLMID